MALVGETLLLRSEDPAAPGAGSLVMALDVHSGQRRAGPTPIAELIASQRAWVRAMGSQPGFWVVDPAGRIWLGPGYHDGKRWTVLAKGGALGAAAQLTYSGDGLLDPDGQVWVPYRLERSACQEPGACVETGLQAFGPEGPRQKVLLFGAPSEGASLGARDWVLLHSQGAAWALGPRWGFAPPSNANLTYPYLSTPAPGALRNAGYASSAWWSVGGTPRAALWLELQEPSGPRETALLLDWDPAARAWREEPLTDCPLLRGAGERRITAGVEGRRQGQALLWLGSNQGEVAAQVGQAWQAWPAREMGLGAVPIRQLVFHPEGGLWASAGAGLARFGLPLQGPAGQVYLPSSSR